MFRYYFALALRSFRRGKVLTALMVLAIALGIGTSMTTSTVFYVLSGDPLPGKSNRLYYPQLDAESMIGYTPGQEPNDQLTRFDGESLLASGRADRQALMTGGRVAIEPESADIKPFYANTRYTSADFFPMFDVPFRFGRAWSAPEDENRARVVVISRELNERLFGGGDSTGRRLRVDQNDFRIIGVLDEWRPHVRFYDLSVDIFHFGRLEDVFIPFSTSRDLGLSRSGSVTCWGTSAPDVTALNAPCVWTQLWVQIDSPQEAEEYRAFLENYSEQQRAAGRFERPTNVRLLNLGQWLDQNQIVPSDVRLQAWLAFGFLAVCLVNTIGLLLAKFMSRSGEIGVRRALGAARRAIFAQLLVEAGVVGLVGGLLGLGLAALGLWAVRLQPVSYAQLAELDGVMLAATLALALISSLLAGTLPAWRACRITPAIQLKSQ